jgi:hypothetical protein
MPKLDGHKILYKGRRYIMFEMNTEHPYEGYEAFNSIALWGGGCGSVCAFADRLPNGKLLGNLAFTMDMVEVKADTPRQFIDENIRL